MTWLRYVVFEMFLIQVIVLLFWEKLYISHQHLHYNVSRRHYRMYLLNWLVYIQHVTIRNKQHYPGSSRAEAL